MSKFVHINAVTFDEMVLRASQPVLLEFGAVWCGPCRRVEPEMEMVAETLEGKVTIAKLDVDECADITTRYGVMSVPTILLFIDGEVSQRMSGMLTRDKIMSKIEAYL